MMSKVILDLGYYSVNGVNLIMCFQINMRQCQLVMFGFWFCVSFRICRK